MKTCQALQNRPQTRGSAVRSSPLVSTSAACKVTSTQSLHTIEPYESIRGRREGLLALVALSVSSTLMAAATPSHVAAAEQSQQAPISKPQFMTPPPAARPSPGGWSSPGLDAPEDPNLPKFFKVQKGGFVVAMWGRGCGALSPFNFCPSGGSPIGCRLFP